MKTSSNYAAFNCYDNGPEPYIVNIEQAAQQNANYRTALWTGCFLQLTVMCIPAGGEAGLEVHPATDQFLRIESGSAKAIMGSAQNALIYKRIISAGDAVFVPAGTWHNIINTGSRPLKLYTIYAPPHHPHGAVQRAKHETDKNQYCM